MRGGDVGVLVGARVLCRAAHAIQATRMNELHAFWNQLGRGRVGVCVCASVEVRVSERSCVEFSTM